MESQAEVDVNRLLDLGMYSSGWAGRNLLWHEEAIQAQASGEPRT
jgi:hypothetical protein